VKRRHWLTCTTAALATGGLAGRRATAQAGIDAPAFAALRSRLGARLHAVVSPFDACRAAPGAPECAALFRDLRNPFFIGDDPALTQTLGWVDGWTSSASAAVVFPETAADVAAAVNAARDAGVRLVVRGGGHSYQGTSNAAGSLLVSTRRMRDITLHDGFVPQGCGSAGQPAVSLGAGALWLHAYDAVTTKGGRYVQGGGCTTVGVAGLVLSGGFGSFSKGFGLAAAALLEAEVVTADGAVRVVNACRDPDLFWALKGGGGGTFGIVTRLTLRTRPLPALFGAVIGEVTAGSDAAFAGLLARVLGFCRDTLITPHWGEQIVIGPGNRLRFNILCQGLDDARIAQAWAPLRDWLASGPAEVSAPPFMMATLPARHFWDPDFIRANIAAFAAWDERPGAPPGNFLWAGDTGQVGQVLHAYQSHWLPAGLLDPARLPGLAAALSEASRHWSVSLHLNKGLAGASAEDVAAAADTAIHPAALDAFALAISAAAGPPAMPGIAGREPDAAVARRRRASVESAMAPLRGLAPEAGAYRVGADYFEPRWQDRFWGANHARLAAVKRRHDPGNLFRVHHGVEA
jgi:FAD/FMN-containing dehydrogenase